MAAELYWQTQGEGRDLVLVHGWGMNGAVWHQVAKTLSASFRVHVVDLPGYGNSTNSHATSLENMATHLLQKAPEKAIWVGWSLGGLVATFLALHHPERVEKLITVASSPKFAAERPWRGIQPSVLAAFSEQLSADFRMTIERFMGLQVMGSPSAKQDIQQLKEAVLSRPEPNPEALFFGLQWLETVDLREQLPQLPMPFLRLYGRLDGLVPIQVASDLDTLLPQSISRVFVRSSHAPFITEFALFCDEITAFCREPL